MKKLYMGQKMIVSALAGMILIPGSVVRIQAAENEEQQSVVPTAGIESALEECYRTKVKENLQLYLVPTDEGEYLNIAFSDTDDFTYVRSEPDENSDWTGKLYKDSTVEVLEYLDGWTKIRSGETEGYVPTEKLFTGEDARIHSGEYEENTATVTADRLNVRAGTGTSCSCTSSTRNATICINFIMSLTLRNCSYRASTCTSSTAYAIITNNICHYKVPPFDLSMA